MANLLAETLSASAGTSNVFAYTFATPNTTQNPNTSRKNIFNFCFNDDFVPQVPLSAWGYGKHGITYTVTAGDLYESNSSFKNDMNRYVKDSRNKDSVAFEFARTASLLTYVSNRWNTVQNYYGVEYSTANSGKHTLYTFLETLLLRLLWANQFSYYRKRTLEL